MIDAWGPLDIVVNNAGYTWDGAIHNYASAEAGVVGLTKTLAKEWGQLKMNVNAVAFGYVDTRLTAERDRAGQFDKDGRGIQLGVAPGMRELATATIPLGQPARPDEAAGPVFFLCSPWSDYVNGQVLNVTGGQSGGMVA